METSREKKFEGVGGWLLLFCVILTIVNPAITLFNVISGYVVSSPLYDQFPMVRYMFFAEALLSLALAGFSLYAGLSLWQVRTGAVLTTKVYLVSFLAYSLLALSFAFMPGLPPGSQEPMLIEVGKGALRAIVFVSIWYTYLVKSRRVQQTYTSG